MRLVARVRAARERDEGFTLAELLVTIALTALLTTIVLMFVTTMSKAFTRDRAASDSSMVASVGMNELTRVIRSGTTLRTTASNNAPVFVAATDNEVTLYAYIDTSASLVKPVKVKFSIDSQRRLIETRWAATTSAAPWTFAATAYSTRTVARSIPAGSDALFTYLDASSNALSTKTAFTEAQLRTIAAVQVTLTVQADQTGRAKPVRLQNAVGIPNLDIPRVRS